MFDHDDAFDALAEEERRRLLIALQDHGKRRVPELSSADRQILNARETLLHQYLTDSLEVADVDKAVVRMHQVHLPKLDDYEFIEWERDAHFVRKGTRFDDIEPLLDLLDDHREARPETDAAASLQR